MAIRLSKLHFLILLQFIKKTFISHENLKMWNLRSWLSMSCC